MQAQKLQLVAANRPETIIKPEVHPEYITTEFINTNAFNPIQHLLCIKDMLLISLYTN